jgi:ABC-type transport system involved in multi-copper enzyme maturation permease subunit
MLPLIACIPFADTLTSDRKQGYLERLVVRERYKNVLNAKFFANAIAGALASALPLLLLYLILTLTKHNPLNHPALNSIESRPYEIAELVNLYKTLPDLFILVVSGAVFFIGAIFASLGMAFTLLINHRFIALSVPFLLSNLLQYFSNRARLLPWYLAPSVLGATISSSE